MSRSLSHYKGCVIYNSTKIISAELRIELAGTQIGSDIGAETSTLYGYSILSILQITTVYFKAVKIFMLQTLLYDVEAYKPFLLDMYILYNIIFI